MLTFDGLPPVQPLICYEAVFSRHLIAGPDRPAWLLQATNDAWFGNLSGPWQHLAQARLRAIESGRAPGAEFILLDLASVVPS